MSDAPDKGEEVQVQRVRGLRFVRELLPSQQPLTLEFPDNHPVEALAAEVEAAAARGHPPGAGADGRGHNELDKQHQKLDLIFWYIYSIVLLRWIKHKRYWGLNQDQ